MNVSLLPKGTDADAEAASVLRKLAVVWSEFEARLESTPLIRKLTRGRFELADYHAFLTQLRQQVKDGALWMSRAASNIDEAHLELRSTLMRHAVVEHRDFRLLEADFVAAGGDLAVIQSAEKNVGSEALSAWMFHEASRPSPFGLLGAMFIIEGLGSQGGRVGRAGSPQARAIGRGGALPALSRRERRRSHGGVRGHAAPGSAGLGRRRADRSLR